MHTRNKRGGLIRALCKKDGSVACARDVREGERVFNEKAQQILARFLPVAARAWVDGLGACKSFWNHKTQKFEDSDYPDHKIRSDCAEEIWHNVVGRPIERSMQVTGNYQELSELIENIRSSPEAQRLIAAGFFQVFTFYGRSRQGAGPRGRNYFAA